jgi:hypothetical protein
MTIVIEGPGSTLTPSTNNGPVPSGDTTGVTDTASLQAWQNTAQVGQVMQWAAAPPSNPFYVTGGTQKAILTYLNGTTQQGCGGGNGGTTIKLAAGTALQNPTATTTTTTTYIPRHSPGCVISFGTAAPIVNPCSTDSKEFAVTIGGEVFVVFAAAVASGVVMGGPSGGNLGTATLNYARALGQSTAGIASGATVTVLNPSAILAPNEWLLTGAIASPNTTNIYGLSFDIGANMRSYQSQLNGSNPCPNTAAANLVFSSGQGGRIIDVAHVSFSLYGTLLTPYAADSASNIGSQPYNHHLIYRDSFCKDGGGSGVRGINPSSGSAQADGHWDTFTGFRMLSGFSVDGLGEGKLTGTKFFAIDGNTVDIKTQHSVHDAEVDDFGCINYDAAAPAGQTWAGIKIGGQTQQAQVTNSVKVMGVEPAAVAVTAWAPTGSVQAIVPNGTVGLTAGLTSGTPPAGNALAVSATTVALNNGDTVTITDPTGAHTQNYTVSGHVGTGATSIPLTAPGNANFSYPAHSYVFDTSWTSGFAVVLSRSYHTTLPWNGPGISFVLAGATAGNVIFNGLWLTVTTPDSTGFGAGAQTTFVVNYGPTPTAVDVTDPLTLTCGQNGTYHYHWYTVSSGVNVINMGSESQVNFNLNEANNGLPWAPQVSGSGGYGFAFTASGGSIVVNGPVGQNSSGATAPVVTNTVKTTGTVTFANPLQLSNVDLNGFNILAGGIQAEQPNANAVAPTLAAGTGAGTSPGTPTFTGTGTDMAGTVTLQLGTTPGTGAEFLTVTFATAKTGRTVNVVCSSGDSVSSVAKVFVSLASTTQFKLRFSSAPGSSPVITVSYVVVLT